MTAQQGSDAILQRELALMTGASGSVIRSVASAMRDEISELKESLDMASQGVADTNYQSVAASLNRLGSTLDMINKDDESRAIKLRAREVSQWAPDQNVEGEAFHGFFWTVSSETSADEVDLVQADFGE